MSEPFFDIEEEYKTYTIHIEKNPDQWRGGFIWSVCKEDEELETGLDFTVETAREEAQRSIDSF